MIFFLVFCLTLRAVIAGPLSDLDFENLRSWDQFEPDLHIIGGRDAKEGEVPYQVSLRFYNRHFCGGTIIDAQWVLTAAHCLFEASVENLKVRYDTLRLSNGTDADVDSIYVHEDYNSKTIDNDIALIKLASNLSLGDPNANTIDLPPSGQMPSGIVKVSGWGSIREGGPVYEKLQVVQVPVVNHDRCNQSYSGRITDSMFCAGLWRGGKDACQGDSGGPAANTRAWTVVGIVSWGHGCARPNYPGVYTRVSKYIDWIYSKMNRAIDIWPEDINADQQNDKMIPAKTKDKSIH